MRFWQYISSSSIVPFLFFFGLLLIAHARSEEEATTDNPARSWLHSLFNWKNPALFPSSAYISLTDDNSSVFFARPADFGPLLPEEGLSGQLWIGKGFGEVVDEATLGLGEFGCSDVEESLPRPVYVVEDGKAAGQIRSRKSTVENDDFVDATDDHLHRPHMSTSLRKDGQKNRNADIQSIQESADIKGKVVLLRRGGCGFYEKVKWTQRRGGVALIVGDNVHGGPLITMTASGDTSNVTIPALFTSHFTAALLAKLVPNHMLANPRDHPLVSIPIVQDPPVAEEGGRKLLASQSLDVTEPKPGFATRFVRWSGLISSHSGIANSIRMPNSGFFDIDNAMRFDASQKTRQAGSQQSEVSQKDSFEIGVHDWRDPSYKATMDSFDKKTVATVRSTSTQTTSSTTAGRSTSTISTQTRPIGTATTTTGLSSTPQSTRAVQTADAAKAAVTKPKTLAEVSGNSMDIPYLRQHAGDNNKLPANRTGLWVTLTPGTISTSPFFDTLLVLVVSPLVTLSIVYLMLIIRTRIQRRRWRAPKSVVEQLPIRTYHSISSQSSVAPSVQGSSEHSPLLRSTSITNTRTVSTMSDLEDIQSTAIPRSQVVDGTEKPVSPRARRRIKQVECVVCLEEYVDGQSKVMSLPCGHDYHVECITPWLTTRRRTCPICKGDVVRSLATQNSSSDEDLSNLPVPTSTENLNSDVVQSEALQTRNTSAISSQPITTFVPSNFDETSHLLGRNVRVEERQESESSGLLSWFRRQLGLETQQGQAQSRVEDSDRV